MAQWYYGENGVQRGPVDDSRLADLVQAQQIGPATLVWKEGMAEWRPLAQVQESGYGSSAVAPDFSPPASASPYAPAAPYASTVPYAPPAYYQPGIGVPTSGLAVASMACGIVGLVTCTLLPGIPAVICGHMALSEINRAPTAIGGRGMAMAGLITGYLCLLPLAAILIYLMFTLIFLIL